MGRAAVDHSRATRIAEAARGGFSEDILRREAETLGPGALRLLSNHDTARDPRRDEAERQASQFAAGEVFKAALNTTRAGSADPVRDLDCLTQAVYFEARGETPKGQAAVAQVVLNRVKHPAFPKTVCAVVFQGAAYHHGCQFSFACDGSMRKGRETGAWDRARHVAARALAGGVLADVGSATHFHTTGVAPGWGPRMLRVTQVGLHVFYRFNPHARTLQPADVEQAVFVSAPATEGAQPTTLRLSSALMVKPAEAKAAIAASLGDDHAAPPQPAPAAEPKPSVAKAAEPVPAITRTSSVPVSPPISTAAATS
jgi:spore germination cell wall hydrolase CwlJ-like protein